MQNVAQTIDAVVAAPIGNQQRLLVVDAHEARRIAARRAIKAVRARGGEGEERRRLDEGLVLGGDTVGLLGGRRTIGLAINAPKRLDAGDDVIAKFRHVGLPNEPADRITFLSHPSYAVRSCRPSWPATVTSRINPGCMGAARRARVKCSVRPSSEDSTNTWRLAPTCASR